MSNLARYFALNNKLVAGYDKTPTKITKSLEEIGVQVHFNDNITAIPNKFLKKENTLVVYTPAIAHNHIELNYFKDQNFTILKRAEVLGLITENTFCFAVAGTHGKTTTSAILGHILTAVKATSFLGGIAENYNSNLILGEDKISVVEADEFDRSFLKLSPNIACITSMDADHLDIYGKHQDMLDSFKDFSYKVKNQLVIANGLSIPGITYDIENDAEYMATNIKIENGDYIFDVKTPNTIIKNIRFSLPGRHNVMNVLAAIAMVDLYGISHEVIKNSLESFRGVQRRFSYKIKSDDLLLIDDYAHHPTEINAVASSIREMYPNEKIMVVFQPHLFSRTRDFVENFAAALSVFDEVRLLEIYPARELPIEGVNSNWLLSKITSENKKLISSEEISHEINNSDAKIIAMLGAGDIGVTIENVKNELLKELKV